MIKILKVAHWVYIKAYYCNYLLKELAVFLDDWLKIFDRPKNTNFYLKLQILTSPFHRRQIHIIAHFKIMIIIASMWRHNKQPSSWENLVFVYLQKDVKQCCDATKLKFTHFTGHHQHDKYKQVSLHHSIVWRIFGDMPQQISKSLKT